MLFKLFGSPEGRSPILDRAVNDFLSMVEHGHWMHGRAGAALWGLADLESTRAEVYRRDIEVNRAERAVRKAIVSHLAMDPRSDLTLCLILMSVVKDAERVGDYCKNMMDLADYHAFGDDRHEIVAELKRLQEETDGLFPKVIAGFRASDEATGAEVVRAEREVTDACEVVIERVLDAPGLTNRQAVAYTLMARFQKRIAAHLGNIASSLVMPIHKLDYFDEEYLPGQEPPEDNGG